MNILCLNFHREKASKMQLLQSSLMARTQLEVLGC